MMPDSTIQEVGGGAAARPEDAGPRAFELLRLCSIPGGRGAARIPELLAHGIDWEEVVGRADWHDVAPAVYVTLSDGYQSEVPADAMAALEERYRSAVQNGLLLTARLFELLEAFDARGIRAVPVKGVVLANTVYEQPAVRDFSDIDLLVSPADAERSREVLHELGFEPAWRPRKIPAVWGADYARPFFRESGHVNVDLHWALARDYHLPDLDLDDLLERTESVTIDGRSLHTLRPAPTLLSLCIHGAKHGPFPWARLKWVRDVAELLRARPGLDWEELEGTTRELGCYRMLLLGLRLAVDLLEVRLPEGWTARVTGDPVTAGLAASVRGRLEGAPESRDSAFGRLGFDVRVRDRLRDRVRYLVQRCLSPSRRDTEMLPLPRFLAPVYVLLRSARLTAKYALRPHHLSRLWRGAPGSR